MAMPKSKRRDAQENYHVDVSVPHGSARHRPRGWREIEALRERKFLEESLADVWDEDIFIDDSVFSDSEHEANYYSECEEIELEDDLSDFDEDDYYEDED